MTPFPLRWRSRQSHLATIPRGCSQIRFRRQGLSILDLVDALQLPRYHQAEAGLRPRYDGRFRIFAVSPGVSVE